MSFAAVDVALLMSEFCDDYACPCCGQCGFHDAGCAMHQALAERGFDTDEVRNAARERLRSAVAGTEPPPG